MAQRPKEHRSAAIVAAATLSFAEVGYDATTIAGVAARAGTSIGNVYRYFAGKEELFAAVVPDAFAAELKRRTRAQITALDAVRDIRSLAPDARYHVLRGELLAFAIAHRLRVVILLGHAKGTRFESFAADFAKRLVTWALAYARRAWPSALPTPEMRFALSCVYANYLASLAQALATFADEERIREAVAHLTAHHQGGLKHLFETAADAAPPRRSR